MIKNSDRVHIFRVSVKDASGEESGRAHNITLLSLNEGKSRGILFLLKSLLRVSASRLLTLFYTGRRSDGGEEEDWVLLLRRLRLRERGIVSKGVIGIGIICLI